MFELHGLLAERCWAARLDVGLGGGRWNIRRVACKQPTRTNCLQQRMALCKAFWLRAPQELSQMALHDAFAFYFTRRRSAREHADDVALDRCSAHRAIMAFEAALDAA